MIDSALLRRILRQQAPAWALKGLIALGCLLALGLFLVPQSYTATASVAIQQPGVSTSPLSVLAGQSGSTRYIGILKSRAAAEQVEKTVHLQQLYHLASHTDAVEMLARSVKPEDSAAEGLLFIHVTLPGPPRLSPQAARRQQIKETAARAADSYYRALRRYYLTSDTDRDSVLVRGADQELRRARRAYEDAAERVREFGRGLRNIDPRSAPATGGEAGPATSVLSRLYEQYAQVQAQIGDVEAARGTQQRLVSGQLQSIGSLPSEDPLLTEARDAVRADENQIAKLKVQLGDDNPRVVAARDRLQIDQAALSRQIQSIRQNRTTPQVASQAQLNGLLARQDTLRRQVAEAQRQARISRELSGSLSDLQTEAQLRLRELEAVTQEAAKVRLENVSAQSRLSLIDRADAPRTGTPGLTLIAGLSLFLVLVGLAVALARRYLDALRTRAPASGSGWTGLDGPHEADNAPGSGETKGIARQTLS